MCFVKTVTKKRPIPMKAKKDIVVYKRFRKTERKDKFEGAYYNPKINGKDQYWTRGFEYEELTPFITLMHSYGRYTRRHYIEINGNAFHSCKTEKGTLRHGKSSIGYVTVEMIIPKGAIYFENKREYVSNRIIFPELSKEK